jgi:PPP family 3-phenylpropionic acid transporter
LSLTPDQVRRRQLVPFAALSASYFAHIGFFNPYLPLWLKELGLGLVAISVLGSLQSLTRLFAPYAWGALSDRTGERVKLLRYGATAALVVSLGLWVDGGLWWLALVLLVMFTHTSSMMPMSEAAMAHLVSRGGAFDARRYGRVRLWGSVGFLVTVFAAGGWFEAYGMQHFPAWTLLTLTAVTLSVWALPDHKEVAAADAPPESRGAVAAVLRQGPVRWLFASMFFHILAHIGVYVFFSLHLDALGYSKTTIGLLWAVGVLVEIGWFYSQSRWIPRFSLSGWLMVAALVMTLRMAITASLADVLWLMVFAQALHAVTFAAHHTACIALLSHHFPGRLRGRGQALYTVIGYGIPGVLGALAGGVLSTEWGLTSVFWASTLAALLAAACVWRMRSCQRRVGVPG